MSEWKREVRGSDMERHSLTTYDGKYVVYLTTYPQPNDDWQVTLAADGVRAGPFKLASRSLKDAKRAALQRLCDEIRQCNDALDLELQRENVR